jgi:ribose-phosphate pyrophosphokinase
MIRLFIKNHDVYEQSDAVEFLNFPDNESFVKLNADVSNKEVAVVWNYENDAELMRLGLLTDVIINNNSKSINLYIPYVPHARQDRASTLNQPFSLRVLIKFLSSIGWDMGTDLYITCLDIHSNIFEKLFNDYSTSVDNIGSYNYANNLKDNKYDGIICPDKGALDRCKQWGAELNLPIYECTKNRDPSTGQLSNPSIPDVDLNNKKLLLVDDIGTGFGTHVMLANEFHKKFNNLTMDLWVTHSSFTRGRDIVLNVFNKVYTTDSLAGAKKNECDRVIVFDCLEACVTVKL